MGAQVVLVVNVDTVFMTNFVTDLAWLWAAGRLAGARPGRWRLGLAAAAGAAAAVWAYFPSGRWLTSLPGLLLGTAGLLAVAFWPCRPAQVLRVVAYFLLTGGVMAGVVVLASTHWPGDSSGDSPFPSSLVASGVLVSLVGVRYLWESAQERSRLARGLYSLRIGLGERSVDLPALLDTGNTLREPLTGIPVVVVQAAALERLLPPLVQEAVTAGWAGLDHLPGSWAVRCRLVPYRAVGRATGLLLAFAPDELWLRSPGPPRWERIMGLVGLTAEPLHPEGAYQALLPLALGAGKAWEGETG